MKLDNVLQAVKDATNVKTASETRPETKQAEKTASITPLKAALEAAVSAAEKKEEKTAGAASPVADLEKMASALADSDVELIKKEAQVYGEALADAFVSRLAVHNEAATKVAANVETPALDDEKLASAAYTKGFEDATQTIYKVATDCFTLGFNATADLLKQ